MKKIYESPIVEITLFKGENAELGSIIVSTNDGGNGGNNYFDPEDLLGNN